MNSIRNTLRNINYNKVYSYPITYVFIPTSVISGLYTTYIIDADIAKKSVCGIMVFSGLSVGSLLWPIILPFTMVATISAYKLQKIRRNM